MLAALGQPFDSDQHFFEFKWDGIRTQVTIEASGVRLMSRNGIDISDRYPELEGLSALPQGLVLDGELVAFRNGKPDFETVLGRGKKRREAAAVFVAFDILYEDYSPVMDLPFAQRRERLERAISNSRWKGIMLSEGVRGGGRDLFQTASAQGMEGVVAKRLSSAYAPGKRNGAWVKFKVRSRIQAVIIGFIDKGSDFQSILVAANNAPGGTGTALRYIGKVGGGFTAAQRARLYPLLKAKLRESPLVPCNERACWTEPEYYCTVSFADWTQAGMLRAPVFEGLCEE
jgi:bifunctional non-homologous end joining protein LigD